jgi:cold shock CspA family protein
MPDRMKGTIYSVNSKGYGFIHTSLNIDFFFHHSAYKSNWKDLLKRFINKEPLECFFDNDPSAPDGPRALNVVLAIHEVANDPK